MLHIRLLGGVTIAGFILYAVDAISQNALGQIGIGIMQSLFTRLQALMTATDLYAIIVFLILIIIGLTISFTWLWRKYKRLERKMQQKEYIEQIDDLVLTHLPLFMTWEKEGESRDN
ncbi:hypothetical protein KSF_049860 [Reticulibacter mediterranei]|uniref:Uncharacterized protein n=1 Tax=Reticulibacter mediterranei TaxID=2778369 RepID=A0A8J3IJN6_9CHLR|nr:hypothetical protein KSF_049860 [Reticulibacter mediterranei]